MTTVPMFLIVGHPRCGTGFMATVFQELGWDVGHETVGRNGTSNWVYAVPKDKCFPWVTGCSCSYVWDYVVHCVRDPFTAIASIAHTEIFNGDLTPTTQGYIHVKTSTDFRRRFVYFPPHLPLVEQAILSFLGWNRIIEDSRPDCVIRVEHVWEDLTVGLKGTGWECNRHKVTRVQPQNQRKHVSITQKEWEQVTPGLLYELDRWCIKYGYDTISSRVKIPYRGSGKHSSDSYSLLQPQQAVDAS